MNAPYLFSMPLKIKIVGNSANTSLPPQLIKYISYENYDSIISQQNLNIDWVNQTHFNTYSINSIGRTARVIKFN